MNSVQTFYTIFYILDRQYDKTEELALAQFLGDMNPFLFENSVSADPAIYDDFCKLWNGSQETETETETENNTLKIAIEFLLSYKGLYDYDLEIILKCFDDLTWSNASEIVMKKFPL